MRRASEWKMNDDKQEEKCSKKPWSKNINFPLSLSLVLFAVYFTLFELQRF